MQNRNRLDSMKMETSSRIASEAIICSAITAFAMQLDPTIEEIGDIKTAINEAVGNVITHAYPYEPGKILVSASILKKNVLEIKIRDRGRGIDDINAARAPLFSTREDLSGMGFTLIESFMSEVKISSTPGNGTTVTMRKKIIGRN